MRECLRKHSCVSYTFVIAILNGTCVIAKGKCFGHIIVPPVHLELFSILENKLIGFADDSTLMVVAQSPGV